MAEMTEAAGLVARVIAQGGHVVQQHIVVVLTVVGQSLLYHMGRSSGMTHHHALPVVDILDGNLGFGNLALVVFFPVHK